MHPLKSTKDRFSNNKNLNFNFNSGNGFIDPRSTSQDIKLVLKGYKLIIRGSFYLLDHIFALEYGAHLKFFT